MSSPLQSTGSSPYVLVHIVGPLAATIPTKMANDVLGAQAHFSTTQQSFSSSSDMKKQTCGISTYISFSRNKNFLWEARKVTPPNMIKIFFYSVAKVNYGPPASTTTVLSVISLMGRSYDASTKKKWQWKPDVLQQLFITREEPAAILAVTPLLKKCRRYAYFVRTTRQDSKKSAGGGTRSINVFQLFKISLKSDLCQAG